MNTMQDIADISTTYITNVLFEIEGLVNAAEDAKKAADIYRKNAAFVREGQEELKKLKLSPEDRQHLSLLRNAFKRTIKYLDYMANGQYKKAVKEMIAVKIAVDQYRVRKNLTAS